MLSRLAITSLTIGILAAVTVGCGDDDTATGSNGGGGSGSALLAAPTNLCSAGALPPTLACGQVNFAVAVTGPQWDIATAPTGIPTLSKGFDRAFAADTTYTLNDGNLTVTVTTSSDDTAQYFEVIFNGTDGSETYTDFTYADGVRDLDRREGKIRIYDQSLGDWSVRYQWFFTALNQYFTAGHELNTGSSVIQTFSLNMNEDNSGLYLHYYEGGEPHYRVTWDASGSGDWIEYDTDGTTVLDSGSW